MRYPLQSPDPKEDYQLGRRQQKAAVEESFRSRQAPISQWQTIYSYNANGTLRQITTTKETATE
jgi:hypothetical protein